MVSPFFGRAFVKVGSDAAGALAGLGGELSLIPCGPVHRRAWAFTLNGRGTTLSNLAEEKDG